ncbi:MAG: NAD(P)/FAD-dependent oxidoreductase [Burkholderiaceae bacterium]
MTDSTPSAQASHVVIIGAGMVGVSCALWLQRAGHRVTLLDPRGPAGGASQGNAGVLAAGSVVPVTVPGLLGKAPGMLLDKAAPLFVRWSYLPKLLPFLARYLRHGNVRDVNRIADALTHLLHDAYDQHMALAAGTGAEKYLSPGDYVFAYPDRAAYENDAFGWSIRRAHEVEFEEMAPDRIAEYDPLLAGRAGFAVRCGNHGRVSDPGEYVRTLAQHVVSQGGRLIETSVKDIRIENGQATGVITETEPIEANHVVLTSGVWSGELAQRLGLKVPMEAEGGYHIEWVNPTMAPRSPTMVAAGKFVLTPMDGRLRSAGVLEFGGINDKRTQAALNLLKTQTKALLPELSCDRVDEWMGFRPAPADSIPLIGPTGAVQNAWVGFGHHHVGLTSGPKTGRWLAQLIDKTLPAAELSAFSPDRFRVT